MHVPEKGRGLGYSLAFNTPTRLPEIDMSTVSLSSGGRGIVYDIVNVYLKEDNMV